MTKPVLDHMGETKLALGPLGDRPGAAEGDDWLSGIDETGIAWLALDRQGHSVNTISQSVLRGLADHLDRFEQDMPKAVVIRSAKMTGFAAGADITALGDMSDEGAADLLKQGHDVLDRLAALDCPTICVTHGAALGAGFELALACDWRIAVEGASFGFPEVKLGLHPGLGGSFRLPALIDPTEAMTLMLTGKSAHTAKAKSLGIADVVCPERHVAAAIAAIVAGDVRRDGAGLVSHAFKLGPARAFAARKMRARTAEQAPPEQYPAPYALIDLWEEHGDDPGAMQQAEIASFAHLLTSETSRNLRRVFFLRQGLKDKARGDDGIAHVHVVGAGSMGGEIAAWAALKGKSVTLGDVESDPLAAAMKRAREICGDKHLNRAETRDVLDRLVPDPQGYGIERADLVIEAAPEQLELKRRIFADLGVRMKPDAILASNTSSLPLTELADQVTRPDHFAGLHFFNPVSRLELVEVVAHAGTAKPVMDRLAAFCGAIDRLPVRLRDYPGFLVNRALTPYLMEAMVLMDEGIAKDVIDRAAIDFGMPMGPVALADQVGLDICLHVSESLKANLDKPMPDISAALREKVEAGETGKKAGRGFYDWSEGTPHPEPRAEGPDGLADRLILPMLDACVECLRKDVVGDPDEVDAALVFATGFAPFRGGPMHYARSRGLSEVASKLSELAERHGPRFTPDAGWSGFG
ncbi:3-hydroxyacyl-CoA dehydrogenase/enoyl-CoA hydratase/3-hydroxybutyryl-CoA epimerase [Roseovarius halotolerans]|uniref:enoyl-CoA hydratase n=1 Tax=Roseovarius halotolerans TaxID=505353 RepID=A0A1X6YVE0_9RHOB|nr:3-hydroxyacyl-CoA dehydrogenase NAD-binding domain-containing protein [Roseovarius halotolerans]RKT32795.1 3-hydroxyacyl-CoA dehydrogenase/enoyl-CoA hydratase/3-hydroxybutyryl-CoA epimerase [Roseovarius halotolerans]SLN32528.1 Fatty acid oxidation complex subunit alpha [Roseovarius halotolerans]